LLAFVRKQTKYLRHARPLSINKARAEAARLSLHTNAERQSEKQFNEAVEQLRGRALKRAIAHWYLDKTPRDLAYQCVKYQQRNGWSQRDLLRLAKPKANGAQNKEEKAAMKYHGNGAHFEVYWAGAIAELIKDVHRQAVIEGRGEEMVAAFREAVERLRTGPTEFGEILYELPVMRMKVSQTASSTKFLRRSPFSRRTNGTCSCSASSVLSKSRCT
jgi:hypothetical protein